MLMKIKIMVRINKNIKFYKLFDCSDIVHAIIKVNNFKSKFQHHQLQACEEVIDILNYEEKHGKLDKKKAASWLKTQWIQNR